MNDDQKAKYKRGLTKLWNDHQSLKASLVLESAVRENSPLHSFFEWDDKKASHQYRLNQARKLIKIVPIDYKGEECRLVHIPIEHGSKDREGEYQPIPLIVESVDMLTRALSEALTKLGAAKCAVQMLEDAARADNKNDGRMGRIAVALKAIEAATIALH